MPFHRLFRKITIFSSITLVLTTCIHVNAQQQNTPPAIPVGLDSYRMGNQWPIQRIGARAYMRSTYDRMGDDSDAGHFLFFEEEEDNCVTLDVEGKGVLYFVCINYWHWSPWRYAIDGNTYIVKETATDRPADAKQTLTTTQFIPECLFQKKRLEWITL